MTTSPVEPPAQGVAGGRLAFGIVVLPLLVFGGAVVYATAAADRLPRPMATHWSGAGQANGTMSLGALLALTLIMGLVLWAIGGVAVVIGKSVRVRFRAERAAMAWCCCVSCFVSSALVLTIWANVDQSSWTTATLPAAMILVILAFSALGGAIGWLLAGAMPELPAHETVYQSGPAALVARDVTDNEHPVWHAHLRSNALLGLALSALIIGFAFVPVSLLATSTFLLIGLVTLSMSSVTVIVDQTGLWIRLGPLGWPRKHLDLAVMASVAADNIEPMEWGGWGYRVVPGKSAIVMRRGAAIIVSLTSGKQFAVTIDDAAAGAALLEAYRRRL